MTMTTNSELSRRCLCSLPSPLHSPSVEPSIISSPGRRDRLPLKTFPAKLLLSYIASRHARTHVTYFFPSNNVISSFHSLFFCTLVGYKCDGGATASNRSQAQFEVLAQRVPNQRSRQFAFAFGSSGSLMSDSGLMRVQERRIWNE